ncbi:hypothetical protein Mefer_0439 [Methanocaldococcus fervens AG86]|uniref:DUF4044 domain-containing protein n=1 Tax=Methanocaldococcus fervens (strain DSM 4213 / JCM 15782 / AG86) TaxID=573064 RepID=C7P6T3_METFA|nr:hypothetical protein Mefer_0439 [Methanocaldococcus fervens AG86]
MKNTKMKKRQALAIFVALAMMLSVIPVFLMGI